jgi:hypothetical protein
LLAYRPPSNAYPSQSGTYSVGFLGTLDVELGSILVEELGAAFSSLLYKSLFHHIVYFTVTPTELIMLSSLAFSLSQSGTYSVGFLGTLDVELGSILVEELGADSRNGWASAVGSKFFYENGTQFYVKGT